MNRDDIIKLGREAGFRIGPSRSGPDDVWGVGATLERFAALVAAAERESVLATIEELYNMEKDRNAMFSDGYNYALDHIEKHIRGKRARGLEQLNAAAEANGEEL